MPDDKTTPDKQRTPAWKKLGLKLKSTQENGDGEREREHERGHKHKHNPDGDEQRDADPATGGDGNDEGKKRSSKKRRLDAKEGEGDFKKKKKAKKEDSVVDHDGVGVSSDSGAKEVVDADGSSAVLDGKQGQEEGYIVNGSGKKEQTKKKEKEKKKKKDSKDAKDVNVTVEKTKTIHETPVLSYLSRYHNNRAEWKFQKSREVHLFKHILSLEHVPARYNAALLAYLKGLRSEGAKQRLSEAAAGVIKADIEGKATLDGNTDTDADKEKDNTAAEESANDVSRSSLVYSATIEAFRKWLPDAREDFDNTDISGSAEMDDGLRQRLEKRKRAELIWFAVNGEKLYEISKPMTKKANRNGAQNQPGKKKRKNRTVIVEISSSSESESESESESSSNSSSSDSSSESDDSSSSSS
ncbi:hypothetical protein MPDQ_002867 [Monascus purpureus]|uniref:WKF domain-containing protein n=1 Tax=Monascus purpureus TaxID=5098 RepID=A0A507QJP8_MONPU|nr:hypothetical protein MPDQ_002867 [Monascus purpureus]BDD56975.1 hypothetical protein MAP00_002388 [Monascus purpureus]